MVAEREPSLSEDQPRPACVRDTAARRDGVRLAVLATVFFSTSAVLVRFASDLGPLEVASYRLLLGAVLVGGLAVLGRRRSSRGPGERGPHRPSRQVAPRRGPAVRPVLAAGLVAALHFALYIGALYRTSIAHALVLVNLSPLLAMPLAALFLRERFDRGRLPAVLMVIAGLGVMVGLEPTLTPGQLVGDLMAFLAALAYAVYSLIGRGQKAERNVLPYTFWVYLVAGLALWPLAQWQHVAGLRPPAPLGAWLAVALLALLPTAGGHTLYNAALRRADAVTVNLIATQEVTGGVLLGFLLLGEGPSPQAVVGGIIALAGLYLALRPTADHGKVGEHGKVGGRDQGVNRRRGA
jgi:drug/metabolite transporter (DMT)-like permease